MTTKKLNLGCGNNIKPGWVNLDSAKLPGVGVVHDLGKLPLPFADNEFEEILAQDILEHLSDWISVLRDLGRILASGGKLIIRVPHFTSVNNFADPTHRSRFSLQTFDFFIKESRASKARERPYYFDFFFSKIISKKLIFPRWSRFFVYSKPIEWLVNRFSNFARFYESSGLCYLFPAENVLVILIK